MNTQPVIKTPETANTPQRRRPGRAKRIVFATLALGLAALVPLAAFFFYAFFVQYRAWETKQPRVATATDNRITRRDPLLGWVPVAPAAYKDLFGPGRHLHFNRAAVRGVRETPRQAPAGRPRALCLGDSFMFGLQVGDEETFPAQLEKAAGIEAVNLGLPGYGLDQCLLRYRAQMLDFDHQWVILGLITDDFRRVLTDRGASGFFKPRFVWQNGALELTGVPTPAPLPAGEILYPETRWQFVANRYPLIGRLIPEAWMRGVNNPQEDPRFSQPLSQRILLDLEKLCAGRGKRLLIVWMPTWQDFKIEHSRTLYRHHHQAFTDFAKREHLALLDLTSTMENAADAEFESVYLAEPYHHPGPEGYRRFAQQTAEMLKRITED